METTKSYQVGDTITYIANGGERRTGVVSFKGEIKNGRNGFDIDCANGEGFWGYDSQIVRVGA